MRRQAQPLGMADIGAGSWRLLVLDQPADVRAWGRSRWPHHLTLQAAWLHQVCTSSRAGAAAKHLGQHCWAATSHRAPPCMWKGCGSEELRDLAADVFLRTQGAVK